MKYNLLREARRRLNDMAEERVEQFNSPLLHNHVYETVGDKNPEENPLADVLNTVANLYRVSDRSDVTEGVQTRAFRAAGHLDEEVERVADRQTAKAVAYVYDELTAGEVHHPRKVAEAKREARSWFLEHEELAESVDAWEENELQVAAD